MKQHTFSSNSWHFWLANIGVKRVWSDDEVDICSYIRKVFAGAFVFTFMTVVTIFIIAFFSYGFITMGIWFFTCLMTGVWVMPNPIAGMLLLGMIFLAFGFLVFCIKLKIQELYWNMEHAARVESPSFTLAVYKKFKNKTCFTIGFTNERK